MNPVELRGLQAPLKARYRESPESAVVTLKARGTLGSKALTCKVETGKALVEAGLHPATGGTGMAACSGDLLLEALVACAGVTLAAVATAIGVRIASGTVLAEARWTSGAPWVSRETRPWAFGPSAFISRSKATAGRRRSPSCSS